LQETLTRFGIYVIPRRALLITLLLPDVGIPHRLIPVDVTEKNCSSLWDCHVGGFAASSQ